MPEEIGGVSVKIRGDFSHLKGDMEDAQKVVQQSLSGFDLKGLADQLTGIGTALTAGVTIPITAAGLAIVSVAGKMEQAGVAFEGLLGSAQKAGAFLAQLKDFAAKTPFEFPDLVQASKRMLALGFEAEKIVPTLKIIGDTAAGLGAGSVGIDRITTALGQMAAKGKVSAQEMNQLAELGVRGWDILAKAIGVSIPEAMKLAEKGAIEASKAIPALLAGMSDQFSGQMEKQAKTLLGMWSNFKDQVTFILMDFGKVLLPVLKDALDSAMPLLEVFRGLAQAFSELPGPVQTGAVALVALAAAAGPVLLIAGGLVNAWIAVSGAFASVSAVLGAGGLTAAFSAMLPVLAGIAAAVAAVWAAWQLWQLPAVQAAVENIGNALTRFWNDALLPLIDALQEASAQFIGLAGSIIESGLQAAWEILVEVAGALWEGLKELAEPLADLVDALGKLYEEAKPVIDVLKAVASGLLTIAGAIAKAGLLLALDVLNAAFELMVDVVKAAVGLLVSGLKGALAVVTTGVKATTAAFNFLSPVIRTIVDAAKQLIEVFLRIPGVRTIIEAMSSALVAVAAQFRIGTVAAKDYGDAAAKAGAAVTTLGTATRTASPDVDKLTGAKRGAAGAAKDLTGALGPAIPMIHKVGEESSFTSRKIEEFSLAAAVLAERSRRLNEEFQRKVKTLIDLKIGLADGTIGAKSLADGLQEIITKIPPIVSSSGLPAISNELKANLTPALKMVPPAVTAVTTEFQTFGREAPVELKKVGDAVRNFVLDAGNALFNGEGSFGERLKRMWQELKDAAINLFLKPVADAMSKFVTDELSGLVNGVTKAKGSLSSALSLNYGGAARDAAGALPRNVPFGGGTDMLPGAPSGGATGGMGGAGGGGGGLEALAGGPYMALAKLAIEVIQSFQMAKQETTLNAIEESTRYTKIYTEEMIDTLHRYLPYLLEIHNFNWGHLLNHLQKILESLRNVSTWGMGTSPYSAQSYGMGEDFAVPMGAGQTTNINFYGDINSEEDFETMLEKIKKAVGGLGGQT